MDMRLGDIQDSFATFVACVSTAYPCNEVVYGGLDDSYVKLVKTITQYRGTRDNLMFPVMI
jgi:hypothetical protein